MKSSPGLTKILSKSLLNAGDCSTSPTANLGTLDAKSNAGFIVGLGLLNNDLLNRRGFGGRLSIYYYEIFSFNNKVRLFFLIKVLI